jgi:non-homologous end joining protein Ku
MPVKAQPVQRQTNVINLMDALRRSVEGAGAPGRGRSDEEERAPPKKAEKAPARKAEKSEKAASKTRATPAKSRARKAG